MDSNKGFEPTSVVSGILMSKYAELKNGDDPDISFTRDEIDIMMDANELRCFKMESTFPKDFQFCKTKEECIEKILARKKKDNELLYRLMEYCVISQPVLQLSVSKVFKNWRYINGRFAAKY